MRLLELLQWADRYPYFFILVQNDPYDNLGLYRWVMGMGRRPHRGDLEPGSWYMGGWTYEWQAPHREPWIKFPTSSFFEPQWVLCHAEVPSWIIQESGGPLGKLRFVGASLTREAFEQAVEAIRGHIYDGNVYQVNLSTAFLWEGGIDPLRAYIRLLEQNPTLYNFLFKWRGQYVIGASPERFCWLWRDYVAQQPIKGTARRGQTLEEDAEIMKELRKDPKEMAENTMILDMVRNNFYRFCLPSSVAVYKWADLHTYAGLHHLVSGVSGRRRERVSIKRVIECLFPAASMTGAPQQAAMQYIRKYEPVGRGIYSGALGYLSPEGEGDFAVVIRSWVYDARNKKLVLQVGSGITYHSDPTKEWQETLLKADLHLKSLDISPARLIS